MQQRREIQILVGRESDAAIKWRGFSQGNQLHLCSTVRLNPSQTRADGDGVIRVLYMQVNVTDGHMRRHGSLCRQGA